VSRPGWLGVVSDLVSLTRDRLRVTIGRGKHMLSRMAAGQEAGGWIVCFPGLARVARGGTLWRPLSMVAPSVQPI